MYRELRLMLTLLVTSTALGAAIVTPALAAPAPDQATTPARFPTTIALPNGFAPEGIAIGSGLHAYFGSRVTGSIYRADLATGAGAIIAQGPGTPSLGLKVDGRNRLFVAGGTGGNARVINAQTGALLASYQFATGTSFVNDEILTPTAGYFTDSANPVLYRLPLGRNGGLPPATGFTRIPLTGDIVFGAGTNANGISTTPDGRALLIVQSNTGLLFRVDPRTGVTRRVDLGGATVVNGDGLLLQGRTLYVVQNALNVVAVIHLNAAGTAGQVITRLTDPRFRVPTTVAAFRDRLYLPNARFNVPAGPTVDYDAVAIRP